jgi:hypothetical protein
MTDNNCMKFFNKYIAVFLTLAVLANGVFSAQMTVSMIDQTVTEIAPSSSNSLPCHGEQTNSPSAALSMSENSECCDGDCSNCILSFNISAKRTSSLSDNHQAIINITIDNHKLSAHSSNLFRPPILI